jgi:hypothetical protein
VKSRAIHKTDGNAVSDSRTLCHIDLLRTKLCESILMEVEDIPEPTTYDIISNQIRIFNFLGSQLLKMTSLST